MFILLLLLGNFVKISQIYQKSWKVKAFVSQSCLTICNPIDCSPPGSSVHGILQARILQWFVMPFSRGSSWSRDQIWISYIPDRFFTIWATSKTPYTPKDSPLFPLSQTSTFLLTLWLGLCHWPLDKRRVWDDWREIFGLIGRGICIIFKEAGIYCLSQRGSLDFCCCYCYSEFPIPSLIIPPLPIRVLTLTQYNFQWWKFRFLWGNTLLASKYWFEAFSGLYYRRWNSLPVISRRPSCFPIHHSHPFITFLFLIPH